MFLLPLYYVLDTIIRTWNNTRSSILYLEECWGVEVCLVSFFAWLDLCSVLGIECLFVLLATVCVYLQ